MVWSWVWSSPFTAALAIDVHEFKTPEQERRYQDLVFELRCPKCLNTNLAGSDAPISRDLRREVHRLIVEGRTDAEIRDFMRARYGDFILYEPRLNSFTVLLWFMPVLLLAIAGIVFVMLHVRFGRRSPAGEESPQEDGQPEDGDVRA